MGNAQIKTVFNKGGEREKRLESVGCFKPNPEIDKDKGEGENLVFYPIQEMEKDSCKSDFLGRKGQ